MKYQELIDLGFKRTQIEDSVEFKKTGVEGYFLIFKLKKHIYLEVQWNSLNKIRLWIDTNNDSESYHIDLTEEQMKELVKQHKSFRNNEL